VKGRNTNKIKNTISSEPAIITRNAFLALSVTTLPGTDPPDTANAVDSFGPLPTEI